MRRGLTTWLCLQRSLSLHRPPGRRCSTGRGSHWRVGEGRGLGEAGHGGGGGARRVQWRLQGVSRCHSQRGGATFWGDHPSLSEEAVEGVAQGGEQHWVQGPVAELRLTHALQKICMAEKKKKIPLNQGFCDWNVWNGCFFCCYVWLNGSARSDALCYKRCDLNRH